MDTKGDRKKKKKKKIIEGVKLNKFFTMAPTDVSDINLLVAPEALVISRDPKIYVHDGKLAPEDVDTIRIPKCSDGFQPFAIMAGLWTLVTIVAPIVLLSIEKQDSTSFVSMLGYVLLVNGLVYFFFISSFRSLLIDGVLCMPTPPPKNSSWTVAASLLGDDEKDQEGKLLESAEAGGELIYDRD